MERVKRETGLYSKPYFFWQTAVYKVHHRLSEVLQRESLSWNLEPDILQAKQSLLRPANSVQMKAKNSYESNYNNRIYNLSVDFSNLKLTNFPMTNATIKRKLVEHLLTKSSTLINLCV